MGNPKQEVDRADIGRQIVEAASSLSMELLRLCHPYDKNIRPMPMPPDENAHTAATIQMVSPIADSPSSSDAWMREPLDRIQKALDGTSSYGLALKEIRRAHSKLTQTVWGHLYYSATDAIVGVGRQAFHTICMAGILGLCEHPIVYEGVDLPSTDPGIRRSRFDFGQPKRVLKAAWESKAVQEVLAELRALDLFGLTRGCRLEVESFVSAQTAEPEEVELPPAARKKRQPKRIGPLTFDLVVSEEELIELDPNCLEDVKTATGRGRTVALELIAECGIYRTWDKIAAHLRKRETGTIESRKNVGQPKTQSSRKASNRTKSKKKARRRTTKKR